MNAPTLILLAALICLTIIEVVDTINGRNRPKGPP